LDDEVCPYPHLPLFWQQCTAKASVLGISIPDGPTAFIQSVRDP
jgi:hypothetical protein